MRSSYRRPWWRDTYRRRHCSWFQEWTESPNKHCCLSWCRICTALGRSSLGRRRVTCVRCIASCRRNACENTRANSGTPARRCKAHQSCELACTRPIQDQETILCRRSSSLRSTRHRGKGHPRIRLCRFRDHKSYTCTRSRPSTACPPSAPCTCRLTLHRIQPVFYRQSIPDQ